MLKRNTCYSEFLMPVFVIMSRAVNAACLFVADVICGHRMNEL
jgi:hypothetical protein